MAEHLHVIQDMCFAARCPSYTVVQQLGDKVRNIYIPPSLRISGFGDPDDDSKLSTSDETFLRGFMVLAIREMSQYEITLFFTCDLNTLLAVFYLHRGYFAQAMESNPQDPLSHKYSNSVIAAYESARFFISLARNVYKRFEAFVTRTLYWLRHIFSCAVSHANSCAWLSYVLISLTHCRYCLDLCPSNALNCRSLAQPSQAWSLPGSCLI
jgi:hypothetical protein